MEEYRPVRKFEILSEKRFFVILALPSALGGWIVLACSRDSKLPLRFRLRTANESSCWISFNQSSPVPRFRLCTAKSLIRRLQKYLFGAIP